MGIENLSGREIFDQPKVNKEKSFEFEKNKLKGEWQVIEKNGSKVEGAYFKSSNPNGELVIFIPGAPGDSVSWFEDKDVPVLLDNGYDVFSSRHGGILANENNKPVFHNDQRLEKGTMLGDEEMTVNNWVKEPEILLEHFFGKPITIISHSFGGLAVGHSISDMQEKFDNNQQSPIKKINRWINLSGVNYNKETYEQKYQNSWRWYFGNW